MQLLHRGLWAVGHWGQGDLRVQVQEGREGQSGRVDVLELVDDVTDGLLHAVELLGVLLVSSLKPSGAHSHEEKNLVEEQQKVVSCSFTLLKTFLTIPFRQNRLKHDPPTG